MSNSSPNIKEYIIKVKADVAEAKKEIDQLKEGIHVTNTLNIGDTKEF